MSSGQRIAQTTHRMRQLLAAAGVLVLVLGLPLFVAPQYSDERFFWTVRTDLSAAFLGASYLAAAVIEFTAARERTWAHARIAVPAVLVFTTLTLFITLFNNDQYKYDAPGFLQSAGTWAWLVIYAVVPPIMTVVLWLQFRHGGNDPPRTRSLSPPLRGVLAAAGALLIMGGVTLLLFPSATSWMWPWVVRDLTARAFGAWMVGFGIATAQIAWEDDWRRVRAASAGAGALGVLQLIALFRYLNEPDWGAPQTWVYLTVMILGTTLGIWGWRAARQPAAS